MQKEQSPTQYAIDIGNTRVHCGIISTSDLTCLFRQDFPVADLEQEIIPVLHSLCQISAISIQSPVSIAGGTENTYAKIKDYLHKSNIPSKRFCYSKRMPFKLNYDSIPGADRIADALYSAIAFPNRECIIIGMGTAITINLITDSTFSGGVIIPGMSTQLKSLNLYAPVLPLVAPDGPTPLPGNSTATCIRSGILYGISGAIQRIISEYSTITTTQPLILATGGDWPYISRFIDLPVFYNPDITLIGVALGESYID